MYKWTRKMDVPWPIVFKLHPKNSSLLVLSISISIRNFLHFSIDREMYRKWIAESTLTYFFCNLFPLFADVSFPFEALMDERNASTSFSFQHVCNVKFPCPNCSSVFNRKNNLQKHLKYECGQLPRFKCPYCEYCSKKTSNVRAHIRSIHSGYTVYVIDLKSSYL